MFDVVLKRFQIFYPDFKHGLQGFNDHGPNIQYLFMTQMIVIECYSSLPVINTSAVKCSSFECDWLIFCLITWSQWFGVWEAVLVLCNCVLLRVTRSVFSSPNTNNHPFNPLFAQRCHIFNIFRWKNNWGLVECHLLIVVNVIISTAQIIIIFLSTDLIWNIFAHMYIFSLSVILKCINTGHVVDTLNEPWRFTWNFTWEVCSSVNLNHWLLVIWTSLFIQLFTCLWFQKRKLILFKDNHNDVLEWSI